MISKVFDFDSNLSLDVDVYQNRNAKFSQFEFSLSMVTSRVTLSSFFSARSTEKTVLIDQIFG